MSRVSKPSRKRARGVAQPQDAPTPAAASRPVQRRRGSALQAATAAAAAAPPADAREEEDDVVVPRASAETLWRGHVSFQWPRALCIDAAARLAFVTAWRESQPQLCVIDLANGAFVRAQPLSCHPAVCVVCVAPTTSTATATASPGAIVMCTADFALVRCDPGLQRGAYGVRARWPAATDAPSWVFHAAYCAATRRLFVLERHHITVCDPDDGRILQRHDVPVDASTLAVDGARNELVVAEFVRADGFGRADGRLQCRLVVRCASSLTPLRSVAPPEDELWSRLAAAHAGRLFLVVDSGDAPNHVLVVHSTTGAVLDRVRFQVAVGAPRYRDRGVLDVAIHAGWLYALYGTSDGGAELLRVRGTREALDRHAVDCPAVWAPLSGGVAASPLVALVCDYAAPW